MSATHYTTSHSHARAAGMYYQRRVLCHVTRPDGSVHERIIDLWTRSVRDCEAVVRGWNAPHMTAKESGFC
jgi:hypothetical protein